MEGTIAALNPQRGMVAVATEGYGYTIFEVLQANEIQVGDGVSWKDDTTLGSDVITNHTQGWRARVYFQNHGVNQHQLRQQLLL